MSDNAAAKKPGFIQRIKRFTRDVASEMKKIVWPSKKQATNNTTIVIGVVVVASIFVGGFDIIVSSLVKAFAGLL